MLKLKTKNKKILTKGAMILVPLVIVCFLLIPSAPVFAGVPDIVAKFFGILISGVLSLIVWAADVLDGIIGDVWGEGTVWEGTNLLINNGWNVVRDIINMGFILVLLTIAFATIFQIKTYKVKDLLPKLLIAILLVNFSKHISFVIVDFTEVLMSSFNSGVNVEGMKRTASYKAYLEARGINEGDESYGDFIDKYDAPTGGPGMAFVYAMGIDKLDINLVAAKESKTDMTGYAVQLFMVLIFSIFMAVIFIALMILFFVRMIGLWILVILSPYAFWTFTVPFLKKHMSKWWSYFGKYAFFGPIAMFFLYLAAQVVARPSFSIYEGNAGDASGASEVIQNYFSDFPIGKLNGPGMVTTLVVLGLMGFTVVFGTKMGMAVAGSLAGIGKSMGNRATGWAKGFAGRHKGKLAAGGAAGAALAGAPLTALLAGAGGVAAWKYGRKKPKEYMGKAADKIQGALGKEGLTGAAGRRFGMFRASRYADRAKEVEEWRKEKGTSNMSDDDLKGRLGEPLLKLAGKPKEMAGMVDEMIKRGKLRDTGFFKSFDSKSPEGLKAMESYMKNFGMNAEGFFKANPDLQALKQGAELTTVMDKIKKATEIEADALKRPEVATALSARQVSDIMRNGNNPQVDALQEHFGEIDRLAQGGNERAQQVVIRLARDDAVARGQSVPDNVTASDVKISDDGKSFKFKPNAGGQVDVEQTMDDIAQRMARGEE